MKAYGNGHIEVIETTEKICSEAMNRKNFEDGQFQVKQSGFKYNFFSF